MFKINTVTMREKVIALLEAYEVSSLDISDLTNEILDLFPVIKCDCEDNNYALVEITENLCLECNKPIK